MSIRLSVSLSVCWSVCSDLASLPDSLSLSSALYCSVTGHNLLESFVVFVSGSKWLLSSFSRHPNKSTNFHTPYNFSYRKTLPETQSFMQFESNKETKPLPLCTDPPSPTHTAPPLACLQSLHPCCRFIVLTADASFIQWSHYSASLPRCYHGNEHHTEAQLNETTTFHQMNTADKMTTDQRWPRPNKHHNWNRVLRNRLLRMPLQRMPGDDVMPVTNTTTAGRNQTTGHRLHHCNRSGTMISHRFLFKADKSKKGFDSSRLINKSIQNKFQGYK